MAPNEPDVTGDVDDDDDDFTSVDERFVFEVVERVHDRVLGGIDVLDNVLVAIVAAVAAVVVLAIDKLSDFGMPVFVLLVIAMIVCVAGWFWGRVPGYSEVPELATFIVRVSERPSEAVADSIDDFRRAVARNRRIRTAKVRLAGIAALMLIFGTVYAGYEKVLR